MKTATDITRAHFSRPEVMDIIYNYAFPADGWRAYNGDFHRWYKYLDDGKVRLLNVKEDYEEVANQYRTPYLTLNVFRPVVMGEIRHRTAVTNENPLGTPSNTVAYTLGVDIDKQKGYDIDDPVVQEALNAGAQFIVNYLKDHGIHKSVWVLFSGGGIYALVHHGICKPASETSSPETRAEFFANRTDEFNALIVKVAADFKVAHPEYANKVKFDALNNAKRIFKCILSIHKKKPYAVTPLNRDAIKIDTKRASIGLDFGLSDEVLEDCRRWYSSYDPMEQKPLFELLDQFRDDTEVAKKRQKDQFHGVFRPADETAIENFPPCMTHMMTTTNQGEGKTRFAAIISTYLYEMGWSPEQAWQAVETAANHNGLSGAEHIFNSYWGKMSCPLCGTIQNDGAGFPHLGLKGLDVCKPDDTCKGCRWPGDYAHRKLAGDTVVTCIRALAGVCDGAKTKDGAGFDKMERQIYKDIIDRALNEGWLDRKQEKTAYEKIVKKHRKQLKELGIDVSEVGLIDGGEGNPDDGLKAFLARVDVWIEQHHFKTVSDTEKIYHYDHGVYLDNGEKVLKGLIGTEFPGLLNNKLVSDVVGNVKRRTYLDREDFNNTGLVNVLNGLIDIDTGDVREHSPDHFTTSQLDVIYDPTAACPAIEEYLKSTNEKDDLDLIKEIIGWLLWPEYHVHQAIMLVGSGRNGKGTLIRLIERFLGKNSISHVTLQQMVMDQFAISDCFGKMANIGGDLPAKDLSDTSAFRMATGGDTLRAQEKFRPAFNFQNKAKMIFAANILPRSKDDTFAFYDRWIIIEYLKVFTLANGKADPDLDKKLQMPQEMSGLLNVALKHLAKLRKNNWKFSYYKTTEDVELMYKRNSNPVLAFLLDKCDVGSAADVIEKGVMWKAFNEYIAAKNLRPLSTTLFGELIKDQTVMPVSSIKPWNNGQDRAMCWQGVKFKKEKVPALTRIYSGDDSLYWGKDIDFQSTPSIVLAYSKKISNEIKNENEQKISRIKETIDGVDYGLEKNPITKSQGTPGYPHQPDDIATTPLFLEDEAVAPSNNIEADLQKNEAERKTKEVHDRELAAKYSKKTKFYSEMAEDVPNDTSSPEAEQICNAFRKSLRRGDAPRMDYLVKDTGLDEAIILAYLDGATWIRKDDSSPAGIVVYLPVEAPA